MTCHQGYFIHVARALDVTRITVIDGRLLLRNSMTTSASTTLTAFTSSFTTLTYNGGAPTSHVLISEACSTGSTFFLASTPVLDKVASPVASSYSSSPTSIFVAPSTQDSGVTARLKDQRIRATCDCQGAALENGRPTPPMSSSGQLNARRISARDNSAARET